MIARIDRPVTPPYQCLVNGRSDDPDGYVDFGTFAPGLDPKVILSVAVVRQAAVEQLGMVSQESFDLLRSELDERQRRIEQLEQEAAELDAALQAVDVIESAGFRARRKPGRAPRKQSEEVAA